MKKGDKIIATATIRTTSITAAENKKRRERENKERKKKENKEKEKKVKYINFYWKLLL